MTKLEFLVTLERQLSNLSKTERNKAITYYSEIIDDMVDNGLTEEEAVDKLGDPRKIVSQYLENYDDFNVVEEEKNQLKTIKSESKVVSFVFSIIAYCIFLLILSSIIITLLTLELTWIVVFLEYISTDIYKSFLYLGLSLMTLGVCGVLVYPIIGYVKHLINVVKKFVKKEGGNPDEKNNSNN